jgi:hypothetical protein
LAETYGVKEPVEAEDAISPEVTSEDFPSLLLVRLKKASLA